MNYPQPDSAVRSAALELTLCPACARYFYNAPDVIIRRLDSFQQVKELFLLRRSLWLGLHSPPQTVPAE